MTHIEVTVKNSTLGDTAFYSAPQIDDIGIAEHPDEVAQRQIYAALQEMVRRVVGAYEILTPSNEPEILGEAINHVVAAKGYDGKDAKLLGEMVLLHLGGGDVPWPPRKMRDEPQA